MVYVPYGEPFDGLTVDGGMRMRISSVDFGMDARVVLMSAMVPSYCSTLVDDMAYGQLAAEK